MKLLVTGGAGFIGSNFIRYVLDGHKDWSVVNFDKLTYAGNLENLRDVENDPRYTFLKGDIADRAVVGAAFSEHKPQCIVNFAAESHVDRSILDASPFIEANIRGTQVLLEAARAHPVDRFLQISTDEVYGALGATGVFTEESPLLPNSPYSASKAAAELLCRAYWKTYGIPVVITRSSNNYGPYQFPEKLIPLMIGNALRGEELPVYGAGKQVRDWIFVEDNCRGIERALLAGQLGEAYNIAGSHEMCNLDVVEAILRILRRLTGPTTKLPGVKFISDPRGAAHDFRYSLTTSKARADLAWEPFTSFEEGLTRTVTWYMGHREWVNAIVSGEYRAYYKMMYGESDAHSMSEKT
jgi:dTDP-glucose 4,6-dehydratase